MCKHYHKLASVYSSRSLYVVPHGILFISYIFFYIKCISLCLSLFKESLLLCTFHTVVHSLSRVRLFVTPWAAARQASLSFTVSLNLLRLMSIESVMPSNRFILCHLLLFPSVFPSIRVFSNESALRIRWPKYWSFSISFSSEYSLLISFRID